jgi:hypothetical protein
VLLLNVLPKIRDDISVLNPAELFGLRRGFWNGCGVKSVDTTKYPATECTNSDQYDQANHD